MVFVRPIQTNLQQVRLIEFYELNNTVGVIMTHHFELSITP